MLTKTLNFDDDVMLILNRMQVEQRNGSFVGVLTCGQIDRKLYEKVNKALDALGGKWNRKSGGHVFDTDPREKLAGLLGSGSLTVERDGFFETPRSVVEHMLRLVPLPRYSVIVLEPSAGKGAILSLLLDHPNAKWSMFHAIEKNPERYLHLVKNVFGAKIFHMDFLEYKLPQYSGGDIQHYYQRIYMNPPFEEGQDIAHVMHAYSLLQPNRVGDPSMMVSVMSEGPFFREDRKAREFREWLDEVGGYSVLLPDGAFKESGTGVKTRLVVIRR